MRAIVAAVLVFGSTVSAAAQQPLLGGFGFGAAVVSRADLQAGAEFNANLTLATRPLPLNLLVGSWVANSRVGYAYEHDLFAAAHALVPMAKLLQFGIGPELHTIGSHVALGGRGALTIPFAKTGAAGLELFARTSLMRAGTQWAFGGALKLAPWKGGLQLGEHRTPVIADLDAPGSWQGILQQLALLQDENSPLLDVLATRTNVILRFSGLDAPNLKPTIARVARVLNASETPLHITLRAPAPAELAAAVTSGGFPAERITLVSDATVTLQATRQPLVSAVRSAQ